MKGALSLSLLLLLLLSKWLSHLKFYLASFRSSSTGTSARTDLIMHFNVNVPIILVMTMMILRRCSEDENDPFVDFVLVTFPAVIAVVVLLV